MKFDEEGEGESMEAKWLTFKEHGYLMIDQITSTKYVSSP